MPSSKIIQFVYGDAPIGLHQQSGASLQCEWNLNPPLLVLHNLQGRVVKRWELFPCPSNKPRDLSTPVGCCMDCFLLRMEDGSIPSPAKAADPVDYVAVTAPVKPGDLMASPKTHGADPGADDYLIRGVDFRNTKGKRFAASRQAFGTIYKSVSVNTNDVMNAAELHEQRRERIERQRQKLVEAVETSADGDVDGPRSKKKIKIEGVAA